ncbi:MAG: pilus assembly PilX N-terminal domain-containing protein [Candidatus Omnitrophica bacterium]|nr:pilus assembly PilX N-terminal domain-containing protein [Candidatus Omnitrophota bacterium]
MLKDQKGMILITAYMVILILVVLGAAFIFRSTSEKNIADIEKNSIRAFNIAEGGLERAIFDLNRDFICSPGTPSWKDGRIYTSESNPAIYIDLTRGGAITVPQYYNNFYPLPYGTTYCSPSVSTSLGDGSFTVNLSNLTNKDNEIWVRSTGNYETSSKTIQARMRIRSISPWDHAIFGGIGATGSIISGQVDIRGSVLLLGNGLEDDDFAIDMIGSSKIGNNYDGLPEAFSNRIPACPTITFNGETVESLETTLRVKQGKVGLSGFANAGEPDVSGDSYKETLFGVYVTDGYGGNQGTNNVYSDNGTGNVYDLGDAVQFPSLSDPYKGYPTYVDYFRDKALVISSSAELANITPSSNFNYSDINGSISMDGNGNMTVSGYILIEGGDLNMNKAGNLKNITYQGKAAILVTDNVNINVNLLTPDASDSFPTNLIGVMTPNNITFATSQIDVMGAFYAEDTITSTKQTDVAGAFVSNYFDMGNEVPKIYKVPSLIDHLPEDFIGTGSVWITETLAWQEL